MHPDAPRTLLRSRAALVALAFALLLPACGEDSFFRSSSTPASPVGVVATTSVVQQGAGTSVGEYAQAVLARKVSKAAAPGTAAALYLEYLARSEGIGANVHFEELRESDQGFTLRIGSVSYDFSEAKVSPTGVEDITLNGTPLSARLAGIDTPVVHDGLRIESGVSYLTAVGHRIVILTVSNRTGDYLEPKPSLSTFLQTDGTTLSELGTLADTARLPAGETVDIAFISDSGNDEPDGLLNYVFQRNDGHTIEVSVPLGKADQSFFQVGEDGTVTGALHSDIGFANGSAVLSAEAVHILSAAAAELANIAQPNTPICAAGHADSVGSVATNEDLSRQRAAAVRDELIRVGVTNEIGVVGHGEQFAPGDELADPNSRRVDIRLERCPN